MFEESIMIVGCIIAEIRPIVSTTVRDSLSESDAFYRKPYIDNEFTRPVDV